MTDKIALFIGPSSPNNSAKADNIIVFDPIKSGDIYKIMTHGFTKIGIVDGVFHGVPSIWHREIHYAITHGIEVYGSSSMGALRAAEMDKLGLIGVGQVYDWYSSGSIVGDDEVALSHFPEYPFKATTIPLVDIRNILINHLHIPIQASTHQQVIDVCRSVSYWHRTLQTLKTTFQKDGQFPEIYKSVIELISEVESIKKTDAQLLLSAIQSKSANNFDVYKFENYDWPSLKFDMYSDLAIELRQVDALQDSQSIESSLQHSNYRRSSYLHSFLAYWIEEKDPFRVKNDALKRTRKFFKNNPNVCKDILTYGLLPTEIQHFTYLTIYFDLISEASQIVMPDHIRRSSQFYLEHNPSSDIVSPSFIRPESLSNNAPILSILDCEIFLVEKVFADYNLDIQRLLDIYTSLVENTSIGSLQLGLQKYILAGTFGNAIFGCAPSTLNAHLTKYYRINKYWSMVS